MFRSIATSRVEALMKGCSQRWVKRGQIVYRKRALQNACYFLLSGKVIIMDLIGGLGTLIGAVVGAVFMTVFETFISGYFESYHIITGAIFVLVVIFLPNGLVGLLRAVKKRGES